MKVAVIGTGYVGSVSAAGLAATGHAVHVFDTDRARAEALVGGRAPVHEPGLDELVARSAGRLTSAPDARAAVSGTDVVLVCVQTPAAADGSIDLSFVERAVDDVAGAADGPLVVALRSTVVPGTTAAIAKRVAARRPGTPIELAANPEFLREGRAVADFMTPDRVVVGTASPRATQILTELYAFANAPVIVLSPSSAELAKYANNALLAMLVSFTNELSDIAERYDDADIVDVLGVVHADRRWREPEGDWRPGLARYVWPGCGYGGSCLPKDVRALRAEARRQGLDVPLLDATDRVNARRPQHLVDSLERVLPLAGAQVAVLGIAFKEGTADVRDSPGLAIAAELERRGARVASYDPLVRRGTGALDAALEGARAWVVATGAPEFEGLPARARAAGAILVDARRRYDRARVGYVGPGVAPERAS